MKMRFTGLLLISIFLLSACGQKGPLYMEKTSAPKAAASVKENNPEAEKAAAETKSESTVSKPGSTEK